MAKLRELKKILFKKEITVFAVCCIALITGCLCGVGSTLLPNSSFADIFLFPPLLTVAVGIVSLSQKNIVKGAVRSLLFAALFEITATLSRFYKIGFSADMLPQKIGVVAVLGLAGAVLWFCKKDTLVSKILSAAYITFLAIYAGFAVFNDYASLPFHIISIILPLAAIVCCSLWLFEGKASYFFMAAGCFIAILTAVFLFTKAPFGSSYYESGLDITVKSVEIDDKSVADVHMTSSGIALHPKKVGGATVTVYGTNGEKLSGVARIYISGEIRLQLTKS